MSSIRLKSSYDQVLRRYILAAAVFLFALGNFAVLTPSAFAAAPQDTYSWMRNLGTPGCNSPVTPTGMTQANGKLYVLDYTNYSVDMFDLSGTYIGHFGTKGTGNGQFGWLSSAGITHDSSGNIYILDVQNYRVQKFDANGNYLSKFGSQGTANGLLSSPNSIAIDTTGNIYVSDFSGTNIRIQKFDTNGNYLSKFGSYGTGNGQFSYYGGHIVISSSGTIYVTDTNSSTISRIQEFNLSGTYLGQVGSQGTGNGQFGNGPGNMAIDSSGNLYVVDYGNQRVQKFSGTGTYLSQFGTSGTGNGQFSGPSGIAIDTASGNIYVSEEYTVNAAGYHGRIQKFTSGGVYQAQFYHNFNNDPTTLCEPLGVMVGPDGNLYVADSGWWAGQGWGNIKVYTKSGTLVRTISMSSASNPPSPTSMAFDASGNLYVVDNNNCRVEKFNPSGTHLSQFGTCGAGNGQFGGNLYGVAIDGADNIYVTDNGYGPNLSRVQKFDTDGNYLSQFGTYGSGNGQFNFALGITIDATGNIYVVDSSNNRVEKFSSNGTYLSQFGTSGSGDGQFNYANSITLDLSGNIYVTDSSNNRVQKFDANGGYLTQFDMQSGSYDVLGVAVDADGNVYVADDGTSYAKGSRVSVWNAPIIPSAPQNLAQSPASATSAKLSWSAPVNVGSAPYTYTIQYRLKGASTWTTVAQNLPSTITSYDLTDLTAGTAYDIQILAVNTIGSSPVASLSFVMSAASLADTGVSAWLYATFALSLVLVASGTLYFSTRRSRH